MCKTGVGAGSSAGADKGPDRRQSNHEWTDDQEEGEGWTTPTQTEAASCTPQTTHQARTPRLETRIATSCAKGGTPQGSSRVEEERYETSRGRHNRGTIRRKCCKQHRRCMIRSKTRLEEVIPEECNRKRAFCAQNTRAFKHQVFDVAPPVFSVRLSTRSRPKIRTRGGNTFLAQTARTGRSGGPKGKQMISNQM